MKRLNVNVAKTTQPAMEEIGKKEVTLYYLVIAGETKEEKVIINCGEKTYTKVKELLRDDEIKEIRDQSSKLAEEAVKDMQQANKKTGPKPL